MKATGIIRRIDDLGRIVIPKEIRRMVGIHEGDPFEILYDNNSVTFQKYSVLYGIKAIAEKYVRTLSQEFEYNFAITDMDCVILASNGSRNLRGNKLEIDFVDELMKKHHILKEVKITQQNQDLAKIVYPIIYEGEIIGSLVVFGDKLLDFDKIDFGCRIVIKFIQSELELK